MACGACDFNILVRGSRIKVKALQPHVVAHSTKGLLIENQFGGPTFLPTRSMPLVVRVFAENQPATAIVETIRALLSGQPAFHDHIDCAGMDHFLASS